MAEKPVMLRLKELEAPEAIAGKVERQTLLLMTCIASVPAERQVRAGNG